ncbi:CLUMA_CG014771, isoform A [Clunio marinus]|uniref:CLUMA_CG014771, isoform A n=1 Tax=Clunio marinus TaxID=568069 RepID=A0A1J1IR96_9DIPT|nr:CLUMA_CG014771, isoform A [Clunio marinus]
MCGLTINFKVIALNQHERARQKNVHANFVTTFHNVYGIVEKTNCDMCQHVWKEFPITRNKNVKEKFSAAYFSHFYGLWEIK